MQSGTSMNCRHLSCLVVIGFVAIVQFSFGGKPLAQGKDQAKAIDELIDFIFLEPPPESWAHLRDLRAAIASVNHWERNEILESRSEKICDRFKNELDEEVQEVLVFALAEFSETSKAKQKLLELLFSPSQPKIRLSTALAMSSTPLGISFGADAGIADADFAGIALIGAVAISRTNGLRSFKRSAGRTINGKDRLKAAIALEVLYSLQLCLDGSNEKALEDMDHEGEKIHSGLTLPEAANPLIRPENAPQNYEPWSDFVNFSTFLGIKLTDEDRKGFSLPSRYRGATGQIHLVMSYSQILGYIPRACAEASHVLAREGPVDWLEYKSCSLPILRTIETLSGVERKLFGR